MKRTTLFMIIITISLLTLTSCRKDSPEDSKENTKTSQQDQKETEKKTYEVIILYGGNVPRDSFDTLVDGFKTAVSDLIKKQADEINIELIYTNMNEDRTTLEVDKTQEIISKIKNTEPDFILAVNTAKLEVDTNYVKVLKDPKFKFVSLNPIPVLSGLIDSWEKPGGNVTGVGVFIQFSSPIRLMKKINPRFNKVVAYSWDKVGPMNDWFIEEVTRSCKQENVELVEFKIIKSYEEEFEIIKKYDKKDGNVFIIPCISARVDKNNKPVDMSKMLPDFLKANIKHTPLSCFDESLIKNAAFIGASNNWYDIGVQMAELGIEIVNGKNPGEIPWEYPRIYNVIINLKRAKDLNLEIPSEVISGAYKVYTDYEGNFVGQK